MRIVRTELQAWNGVSDRLSFFWPRRWLDPHMLCRQVWGKSSGERANCVHLLSRRARQCPAAEPDPIGSCETLLGLREFMPYFSQAVD
jgi:hypothetical protein